MCMHVYMILYRSLKEFIHELYDISTPRTVLVQFYKEITSLYSLKTAIIEQKNNNILLCFYFLLMNSWFNQ